MLAFLRDPERRHAVPREQKKGKQEEQSPPRESLMTWKTAGDPHCSWLGQHPYHHHCRSRYQLAGYQPENASDEHYQRQHLLHLHTYLFHDEDEDLGLPYLHNRPHRMMHPTNNTIIPTGDLYSGLVTLHFTYTVKLLDDIAFLHEPLHHFDFSNALPNVS